jgi:MFS family permease
MTILNGQPIGDPAPKPRAATTPKPVSPNALPEAPNFMLGLMSLIFAFAFPIAGLVLGAIALNMSRRDGYKNSLALAGFVLGLVFTILSTILIVIAAIVGIVFGATVFGGLFQVCQQLGPGVHDYNGATYTCS